MRLRRLRVCCTRFREVVEGLTDAELGSTLGVTTGAAREMRTGHIRGLSRKLKASLPLARELKISP
jgi:hypothetical protein